MSSVARAPRTAGTMMARHTTIEVQIRVALRVFVSFVTLCVLVMRCSSRMRIAIIVTGGVDASGRERVVPALLWLIERLARRHDVHVFALHHYRDPCTYPLLGATVHDVGRVDGPTGLRRFRLRARLAAAVGAAASRGRFDVL